MAKSILSAAAARLKADIIRQRKEERAVSWDSRPAAALLRPADGWQGIRDERRWKWNQRAERRRAVLPVWFRVGRALRRLVRRVIRPELLAIVEELRRHDAADRGCSNGH